MLLAKNNPNVSGWRMENGYAGAFTDREYPKRILESNAEIALELILSLDIKHSLCGMISSGFKIFVDIPGEVVNVEHFHYVGLLEVIRIGIEPKIFDISHGLSNYKPNQRGCFFNSERRLRFFKIYTKYNCEQECLANFTKKECGCVKFSMPSKYKLIYYYLI